MDMDIGEVNENVERVVLEELSSSDGDSEEFFDEDSFTEELSNQGDDADLDVEGEHQKEDDVTHYVMEEEDTEHQVDGGEQLVVESPVLKMKKGTLKITEEDTVISVQATEEVLLSLKLKRETGRCPQVPLSEPKVIQVKENEKHQVEGDEEHQVEGDEEHQVEGDEEHQVEGDEEHQVEGDEEHQVEGDEEHQVERDEEHQVDEDEELQVEEIGEHQMEEEIDHDDDVDFPMSSLKICYTMTLAPTPNASGTGDTVESSSILQAGEPFTNQTLSNYEVELLKQIEMKDATIQDQEMEINSLHDENMMLQKKLQDAKTCIRDLEKEINRFKKEFEEMEFLQDKNEKEKRDKSPKATSPQISCSQQVTSPENNYNSSILIDSSSDLEPPAAKKAKKRVSFNLAAEDPLSIRRSERIFLSTSTSNPVDSDDDDNVETEVITITPKEAENYVPVAKATSSKDHRWDSTKTPGFFCACEVQYSSKGKLLDHVRKHSLGMRFQCAKCNQKFYHRYLYRRHMRRTHGVKTLIAGFSCAFCDANFLKKGLLYEHQKVVHNVSRRYKKKKSKPVRSGVMDTPAADLIPVSKAPATSAPLHQVDEARLSEGFFCICGLKTGHRIGLLTHIRYYSVERNFACTACKRKYHTLRDLRSHLELVHQITCERRNGCRDCGSCFDTKKELFHHLADVHDHGPLSKSIQRSKGKQLVVESPVLKAKTGTFTITEEDTVISAQAAEEALLSLKLKRETGRWPQVPLSVPKVIQVEDNREDPSIAIEVWNDEDYQLLEIQPEDEQLRLLEIDTEEDELPMEEVSAAEINASNLEHGLMGMFGNDSWLCICGIKFQSERSLRSHVLLKSGAKPFKCQLCDEGFPRRDYLTLHHKRCHDGESETISVKLFTCRDCGIQVKSMKKLRVHKKMMHQGSSNPAGMQLEEFAGAMSTSRKRKYPQ